MDSDATRRGVSGFADILVIATVCVVTVAWFQFGTPPTLIRILLVGSLLFVLPGYVLSIGLFPRADGPPTDGDTRGLARWGNGNIDGMERLALAFGLSVGTLPILGVALAASPWRITERTVILGTVAMVLGICGVAIFRRQALDPRDRFVPTLPPKRHTPSVSTAVTITLALAALIAISTLGFTMASPQFGEPSTDLYVLGVDDDGEAVAAQYPDTVEMGESFEVNLGVENTEGETVSYTVIVMLERLDEDGSVSESEALSQQEFELAHGESWQDPIDVSPTMAGDDLRVSFLLYQDEPHFLLDQRTAYRHVHVWIDVPEE